jgi:hypothetical protein
MSSAPLLPLLPLRGSRETGLWQQPHRRQHRLEHLLPRQRHRAKATSQPTRGHLQSFRGTPPEGRRARRRGQAGGTGRSLLGLAKSSLPNPDGWMVAEKISRCTVQRRRDRVGAPPAAPSERNSSLSTGPATTPAHCRRIAALERRRDQETNHVIQRLRHLKCFKRVVGQAGGTVSRGCVRLRVRRRSRLPGRLG